MIHRLFHIHHVAYMQVQPLDNICIVQGGTFHNGAGQLYGVQIGNRSDCAGTSYLVGNPIQACQCTFCLEFVCDGPPGDLAVNPKFFCCLKLLTLVQYHQ